MENILRDSSALAPTTNLAATTRLSAQSPGSQTLELEQVAKRLGGVDIINSLSIKIDASEFVTFLGPSGCGKTTLLRIIAGFISPDYGSVKIGGIDVTSKPVNRRNIGMVFQHYGLFPHMTVAQNVAYGLRIRRVAKSERRTRVHDALSLVHLEKAGDKHPRQLSGGEQQRVAVARALVTEPRVLLMDEPLSNLDAKLREEMRLEIKRLQRELGITTIFVTHDQEEALTMSDRIAVISAGQVQQFGSPQEIYGKPASEFVARFVGKSNLMRARIVGRDENGLILIGPRGLKLRAANPQDDVQVGTDVNVSIRPEAVALRQKLSATAEANEAFATVEDITFMGAYTWTEVALESGVRMSIQSQPHGLSLGDRVSASWRDQDCVLMGAFR